MFSNIKWCAFASISHTCATYFYCEDVHTILCPSPLNWRPINTKTSGTRGPYRCGFYLLLKIKYLCNEQRMIMMMSPKSTFKLARQVLLEKGLIRLYARLSARLSDSPRVFNPFFITCDWLRLEILKQLLIRLQNNEVNQPQQWIFSSGDFSS